jgi:hypothetical protein
VARSPGAGRTPSTSLVRRPYLRPSNDDAVIVWRHFETSQQRLDFFPPGIRREVTNTDRTATAAAAVRKTKRDPPRKRRRRPPPSR